jgi:tetratricopeptide (TPR) repeat protein
MLDVYCQCGATLNLPEEWAGKKGKCPACGGVVSIPAVQQRPAVPALARAPASASASAAIRPRPAATASSSSETVSPVTMAQTPANTRPEPPEASQPPASRRKWPWLAAAVGAAAIVVLSIIAFGRSGGTPDDDSIAETESASVVPVAKTEPAAKVESQSKAGKSAPPVRSVPGSAHVGSAAVNKNDSRHPDDDPSEPSEPLASSSAPRRIIQPAPATRPPVPRGGLTGGSRQYDDFDCQRIQSQHAVRIPRAATMLEVDGQRLPLAGLERLSEARAAMLFLPRGVHAVRFRPGELPVTIEIKGDMASVYEQMRRFFNLAGEIRRQELLSRGARTMDVHGAPFLLNLTGAVHVADEQWEAAERKFRRALRINPLFSPAHLNLAICLDHRGRGEEARREVELAEITNVGNVFGLAAGVTEVRRALKLPPGESIAEEAGFPSYVQNDTLSEEDRRLTALMTGLSKYAVRPEDQSKILNNLAVHFADTGRTELALDHFRSALAVVKTAGSQRYALARQVLSHMSDACRRAGFDEAQEYEQMHNLVTP